LEDQYGSVKVVCWPEQFNRYKSLILEDEVVLVRGRLELSEEGEATIIAQEIQQLESARSSAARAILIRMNGQSVSPHKVTALSDLLSRTEGNATVFIEVELEDGLIARVRPQQFLRVKVSQDLIGQIEAIDNAWKVEMIIGEYIIYGPGKNRGNRTR